MSERAATRWRRPRLRRRHALLAGPLGAVAAIVFAAVSLAAEPTIEATASLTWNPSTATVSPGESVMFKNTTGTSHAVNWESGPETPTCPGVPAAGQASNWNGSCTFAQAGSYKFFCPVHPGSMKGTITVSGPTAPVVTTEPATSVNETGATLNGKVNPSGQATTYSFKYGTTEAYGQQTTGEPAGEGTATVSKSAPISGLTAATTYHFQMVATNGTGTTMGADRTFTTAGPPTATTEPATGIGGTLATLAGVVNPKGLETKYFFNWGTTTGYGQKTTEKSAGSGTGNVAKTEALTGLTPETTYHFQLVAKNSAGGGSEINGIDREFTTLGPPQATTGNAAGISATGATLEGLVNAQGQETSYYFNYGTTASYGQKTATKSAGKGTTNASVSTPVAGLAPETTYHFQLVVESGAGSDTGADKTFTTSATPPPPPPPPPPDPLPTPTTPVITPPPPVTVPDTKFAPKPPAKTRDRTPTIKFKSTVAGATFKCTLDGKALKPCRSPLTTKKLSFGRHVLKVAAVAGGVSDPTPATASFKVVKP
jgi:plastocyanin